MKTTSTALALILAASGAAQAQDVTYLSYGLSYTDQDFGGSDQLTVFTIDGTVEYTINQIYLMADLDLLSFQADGFSEEANAFAVRAGYQLGSGGLAYVGLGKTSGFDEFETFSVGGQYSAGAVDVGLHYVEAIDEGASGTSFVVAYEISQGAEVGLLYTQNMQESDAYTLTLFGSYESGPLSVDGAYQSFGEGDASLLFAQATYLFNDQFRATGSLGSLDFGTNATLFGIGAGYQVADNMWIDASYSKIDSSGGGDAETIGLAFTFETGSRAVAYDRAAAQRSAVFDAVGGEFQLFETYSEFGFGGP